MTTLRTSGHRPLGEARRSTVSAIHSMSPWRPSASHWRSRFPAAGAASAAAIPKLAKPRRVASSASPLRRAAPWSCNSMSGGQPLQPGGEVVADLAFKITPEQPVRRAGQLVIIDRAAELPCRGPADARQRNAIPATRQSPAPACRGGCNRPSSPASSTPSAASSRQARGPNPTPARQTPPAQSLRAHR